MSTEIAVGRQFIVRSPADYLVGSRIRVRDLVREGDAKVSLYRTTIWLQSQFCHNYVYVVDIQARDQAKGSPIAILLLCWLSNYNEQSRQCD